MVRAKGNIVLACTHLFLHGHQQPDNCSNCGVCSLCVKTKEESNSFLAVDEYPDGFTVCGLLFHPSCNLFCLLLFFLPLSRFLCSSQRLSSLSHCHRWSTSLSLYGSNNLFLFQSLKTLCCMMYTLLWSATKKY